RRTPWRFTEWSSGDANDIDGKPMWRESGSERVKRRTYRRLRSIAATTRLSVVLDQSIRYAVGVFSEDALTFNAVDVARSFVIAGLNTSKHIFAVHDVRLAVHDWATVKTRGQQIARIHVTAGSDFGRAVSGWIRVRRQASFRCHCRSNCIRQRQLLVVRATKKPPNHFEALIIEFQLLRQIRSVNQQVKMIRVGQRWTSRIAPSFSIEMQTQHKVRMQFEIHKGRTTPNLAIAVEQDFALPADGFL